MTIEESCGCCAEAMLRPISPRFHAGCKECSARALAGGDWRHPEDYDYIAALKRIFPNDWFAGDYRVGVWKKRIKAARDTGDAV